MKANGESFNVEKNEWKTHVLILLICFKADIESADKK